MDPEFMRKLFDEDDGDVDGDDSGYDPINPSDLDIPEFTTAETYAMILDVPIDVGRMVQDVYLFSKRMAREEEKDTWTAMSYTANPALVDYLRKVNWFHGVVMVFSPPVAGAGQYVGITVKGLEKLIEVFSSDSYKQRKQVK